MVTFYILFIKILWIATSNKIYTITYTMYIYTLVLSIHLISNYRSFHPSIYRSIGYPSPFYWRSLTHAVEIEPSEHLSFKLCWFCQRAYSLLHLVHTDRENVIHECRRYSAASEGKSYSTPYNHNDFNSIPILKVHLVPHHGQRCNHKSSS